MEAQPGRSDAACVDFELLGPLTGISTIARGAGVRQRTRLRRLYGKGLWLKRKGFCQVRLIGGEIVLAELHWYEAHGIGKREMKIKRIIEESLYG